MAQRAFSRPTQFTILLTGLWFALSFATTIVPAAIAQEESCVTARCHASMGKAAHVHSPVKDGSCTMCHQAVQDPEKKTRHPNNLKITFMQKGAELCAMCHEPKNTKKVVHAPILGGDCTSCHDPHQSAQKAMLREPMPKLCFQCHPDSILKHAVMHPPVKSGDCSGCHDNHQSDYPGRLIMEGNALCFMCHPDKEEGMKKKSVHPPVKQSCVLCHDQHGAANKAVLKEKVPEVCAMCHPGEALLVKKALVKHAPMTEPNPCMTCHDPHFSDAPKLLPMAQFDLCIGCHSMELDTPTGKIKNMAEFFEKNPNMHGPLKGKDCVSCHSPHGSDYWRILARFYPQELYTSYSDGKYALCFGCHSNRAFTEIRTRKDTGFRDGERNLHYVHVNKIGKGRTCRACHEEHADNNLPKHVKESISFGGWMMPIQFVPGPSGGSCTPGCHGEKRYTR